MAKNEFEEARRLKALRGYQVLDTPPEPQFEDIAGLITHLCQTPIGIVSLADKYRHWSKASIGLSAKSLSWEAAICSVAIDDQIDPLIIEDLGADPRTREKVIVCGAPFLRFYAGVTLRTPEGIGVGQLCAVDFEPRPGGLSAAQTTSLQSLARHTMALLWFRVALKETDPGLAGGL